MSLGTSSSLRTDHQWYPLSSVQYVLYVLLVKRAVHLHRHMHLSENLSYQRHSLTQLRIIQPPVPLNTPPTS